MLAELQALVRLQSIDNQISRLKNELSKIPAQIEAEKKYLKEYEEDLETTQTAVEAMQKRQRDTEGEIQMADEKLRESRGKQPLVKTNEEYRALTQEIESFQGKIAEFEDQVLECMESVEPLREKVAETKKGLESANNTAGMVIKKHEDHQAGIEHELEKHQRERQRTWDEISSDWQARYNMVHKNMGGLAVAAIIDRTCQGCRMDETIQRFFEIRDSKDEISSCSNCGRIIYYKEAEAVGTVVPTDETA
ncbi:MAG: hypothetical protein QF701_00470 [Nitrospinota bacterium]|nr:hypothetical protein [Nitrospinota bacterium]MDP7166225.1 hypothetical protein [Nitrospinota bacterium]MDP7663489.1 hypothetical protein [Nitrospinota bacterium]HJP12785.1 hypothetical protein [Nitrospinota bacterium]